MNAKKLIALLLALVLCLSFAACGGNEDEDGTTAPEVTDAFAEGDSTQEATEAPVVEDSTAEEPSASEPESTEAQTGEGDVTGETTQAASSKPSTPAEIVAYFNTAVNKVKTGAKSVNQLYITNYLANSPTIPGALNAVYNIIGGDEWLDETLVKNSTGAATYTGAGIKDSFPVEKEAWASKLTASNIKSATCTEKDGVYTIKIVVKGDAKSDNIKHGQGNCPKAFSVVLPSIVNDNIPGPAKSLVGTAQMEYPTGTVTITVDAATGNVKTAQYDVQWTIHFTKMSAAVPLGTRSAYNIVW